MRILIISPVFWPEAFKINELAEAWVVEGHEVEVLAGMPNYPHGHLFENYRRFSPLMEVYGRLNIFRFPVVPRRNGRAIEIFIHYVTWLIGACVRLLTLGSTQWDVVFVFQSSPVMCGIPAILAKALWRTRTVIWVQDLWPEVLADVGFRIPELAHRLVGAISGWIYCQFDSVLTQSMAMIQPLIDRGVVPARLLYVPNWADDHMEYQVATTPCAGVETSFTILLVGNLGRAQSLTTVIGAMECLQEEPGIHWILLGDGPLKAWLDEEVRLHRWEGYVELPGRKPATELHAWYAKADATLLSLGKGAALARTIPSRLQGYLAAGKLILVSADGEVARVVAEAGAGFCVPAGSPDKLASIILQARQLDRFQRKEIGLRGRDYFLTHFSKEVCINAINSCIAPRAQ